MADVDAILARRTYTDRRGQGWAVVMFNGRWGRLDSRGHLIGAVITPDQMRTLIERDLHRAVCPGLRECVTHPSPYVIYWRAPRRFIAFSGRADRGVGCPTLGAALDAARHMTGATP